MKNKRKTLVSLIGIFLICSVIEYMEFLFIRTDETIIADNIFTKLFCILVIFLVLQKKKLKWKDIGLKAEGLLKGIGAGLLLGIVTYLISYVIEVCILMIQGHEVSMKFYISNFALTGATTQVKLSITALLICIVVNVINVWAEEGLFRGLLLKLGMESFNFNIANWIQASLFGIWHVVMVVLSVYDGKMTLIEAIVMAIGYVIVAMILGLEWGLCYSISGTLWMGMSEHFFNNFIGNTLHVVTKSGVDEMQILRIIVSNVLSLTIVMVIKKMKKRGTT